MISGCWDDEKPRGRLKYGKVEWVGTFASFEADKRVGCVAAGSDSKVGIGF